jgi:dephospho-CoA kinase
MFVLGLTGSIGMGKSATAAMLRRAGVPVHDADASVHKLYRGAAAPLVEAAFPGTVRDGVVDRDLLGKRILGDPPALKRLEAIVHPLVRDARDAFLDTCRSAGARLCVLDVPLLFETGGERSVDAVVVVSAPADVQRARVLSRPGVSIERFEAILSKQMPDAEKRHRAHFVIDTARGFDAAERQVRAMLRSLAGATGRAGRNG